MNNAHLGSIHLAQEDEKNAVGGISFSLGHDIKFVYYIDFQIVMDASDDVFFSSDDGY
jgi:hypothetical protein